jgi:hypothetical protein
MTNSGKVSLFLDGSKKFATDSLKRQSRDLTGPVSHAAHSN